MSIMESAMAWIYLLLAGLLEIGWAVGLKASQGFTRPAVAVATIVCMAGSVWLLSLALRGLPLGTAYAIWTGIGTVGAFIVATMLFSESATALRIVSTMLIILGMIGLKLGSPSV